MKPIIGLLISTLLRILIEMLIRIITQTICFLCVLFFVLAADAGTVPVRDIDVHRVGKALVYTVQRGDSLYSIAFQHEKDYLELAKINHLKPPYAIHMGRKIRLTSAEVTSKKTHTVLKKKTAGAAKHSARPVKKKTTHQTHKTIRHQHRRATKMAHTTHHIKKKSAKKIYIPTANKFSTNKDGERRRQQNRKFTREGYTPVRHWQWPLRGRLVHAFSSRNKGIDISGHYHETVHAVAKGKVVYAGNGVRGYGYLVIIKHNTSYLTAYGYNDSVLVKTGNWVKVGQPIAKLGVTPTGRIMLHFEMRYKGKPINPHRYL